jgi:hypothetical protein
VGFVTPRCLKRTRSVEDYTPTQSVGASWLPVRASWPGASAFLVVVCLAFSGCRPWELDANRVVVATPWTREECQRLASQFRDSQATSTARTGRAAITIEWQPVAAGADVGRAARSGVAPDLLVGVSAEVLEALLRTSDLSAFAENEAPGWLVVRDPKSRRRAEKSEADRSEKRIPFSFNDPRNDRTALVGMLMELNAGGFPEVYGRLVRGAGQTRRAGWRAGSEPGLVDGASEMRLTEGVAIPAKAAHPAMARVFVGFLKDQMTLVPPRPSASDLSGLESLTAELLGATLVDAQDELWIAWSALERAGYPERAVRWMTEPPPWPAASVSRMMDRQGEAGLAMLETLAEELAPIASSRAWLTLSWIGNPEPIGLKTLKDLAAADNGRLLAEPRFRAWLRAEWTAWARQRYRRVTRSLETKPTGGGIAF